MVNVQCDQSPAQLMHQTQTQTQTHNQTYTKTATKPNQTKPNQPFTRKIKSKTRAYIAKQRDEAKNV